MNLQDHWFFAQSNAKGNFALDADETRHATKALRLCEGDQLQWTDGAGARYTGTLATANRAGAELQVLAKAEQEERPSITLAVGALHDVTRLEWLVEKATEIGVREICLLQTQRTEHSRYKKRRLDLKMIAAMKQSGRCWLPDVSELKFDDFLNRPLLTDSRGYIAHCYESIPRVPLSELERAASCTILIGPEGDFTETEVIQAQNAGYVSINLGKARLRTETAALVALTCVNS